MEYGDGTFDLNHRCRVSALTKALKQDGPRSIAEKIINTVSCCTSLLIYYNGCQLARNDLLDHLIKLESQIGDLTKVKVPSRHFKLPIVFDSYRETAAIQRYIETQRPYASYLPDNMEFVAKNNGLERRDLEHILLNSRLMTVSVGFFAALPLCLPVDPRHRIMCPKVSRVSLLVIQFLGLACRVAIILQTAHQQCARENTSASLVIVSLEIVVCGCFLLCIADRGILR